MKRRLYCLGCLAGVGFAIMAGAAALPPDSALTIPNESAFDKLPVSVEEVNQVALWNRYPSSWTVHDLTDTWRGKPLDESQAASLTNLSRAFLEKTATELLAIDPGKDDTNKWNTLKGPKFYTTQVTLDMASDPKKNSYRLFFESCPEGILYVNHAKATEWSGGWFPSEVDVSTFMKPGTNIFVYVTHVWALNNHGHQLVIGPPVYTKRILLNPRIPTNALEMDLLLTNPHQKTTPVSLRAEIRSCREPGAVTKATLSTNLQPGTHHVAWNISMKDPVYWSPENPHLYELEIRDSQGQILGRERFGFRTFHCDGKYFYLNGKRTFLYGVQWQAAAKGADMNFIAPLKPGEHELTRWKRFHVGWLKALKLAGINSIRAHSATGMRGRDLFEACDEIGILNYDEGMNVWSKYLDQKADDPQEHMAKYKTYCERYLYNGYNHPSTVMYSFGNELYGARSENMNVLYDHLKPLDKQGRPICPSSGRLHQGLQATPREKRDFQDDHSYYGTMLGSWLYNRAYFRDVKKKVEAVYGVDATPIVNFECIAAPNLRYENRKLTQRAYRMALSDPADRTEHIKLLTLPPMDGWEVVLREVLPQEGLITRYTDEVAAWTYAAQIWRRQIEMFRQEGILQGIGPHMAAKFVQFLGDQPWQNRNTLGYGLLAGLKDPVTKARLGLDWNTTTNKFVTTPGFYMMKRCYSPELISAEWFDRNLIAGSGVLTTAVYLVKDTNDERSYTARVLFRDQTGKVLYGKTIDFGILKGFARMAEGYQYAIPRDLPAGDYRLELYLFQDGKRVGDNYYEVRVFANTQVNPKIQTSKKVGVYLGTDAKGVASVRAMLDAMGLKYDGAAPLDQLDRYQVLILGPGALDKNVEQNGDAIRRWIEAGGRLLAFAQARPGPLPWLPAMQIVKAQAVEKANIMDPRHPALQGLTGNHFDTWSGNGCVADCVLTPLDESAVLVAPCGYVMKPGYAKTALADVVQGRGISVMCQLLVADRYGTDGAATALANNLVRHIVSDEKGYSQPMKGEKADLPADAAKKESDWK